MWRLRRPLIQPTTGNSDCGYMCILAALAVRGYPVLLDSLKRFVGSTDRGLSVRQARDALVACGFDVDPVFFDRSRLNAIPVPGIILCDQGHWIFVLDRKKELFEVFDPILGWSWQKHTKLRRRANGLGIAFVDYWNSSLKIEADETESAVENLRQRLLLSLRSSTLIKALAIFALAQLIILLMPLVAMWSADQAFSGAVTSTVGAATIAFLVLSCINIFITLSGDLLHAQVRRYTENRIGLLVFEALKRKPFRWFETTSPIGLHHKLTSLAVVVDFNISMIRTAAIASISLATGVAILFMVSPALMVPGFVALAVSIVLDLLLERRQHDFLSSHVGTSQNYQRFILDTLSQFPMFVRHDSTASIKRRHRALTRQRSTTQAKLQSFQSWKGALAGLTKSAENLFFVIAAAYFMGTGAFAIGGFVAIAAYKDILSGALSSFFRLAIDYRANAVHRMQAATLFDTADCTDDALHVVQEGRVNFSNVSFRYGSFDELVLNRVTFDLLPGKLTVLQGQSGLGKSTIAKLMLGELKPESGCVAIDGVPAISGLKNVASVFQSESLVDGTLRDNLTLFDRRHSEDVIWQALSAAQIDQFVRSLPMKLNTPIDSGAWGLSGGQRQRILIARALIFRPRLLILDEATAALDVETERAIFESLLELNCTIFAIAHRPEVAKFADRLMEIREDGTILVTDAKKGDNRCYADVCT